MRSDEHVTNEPFRLYIERKKKEKIKNKKKREKKQSKRTRSVDDSL